MTAFEIGFVLFPNITQLDFTGPLQVLHRLPGARVHMIAETLAPVPSDCGLGLVPTTTFVDSPALDLICVPGGFGVTDAMANGALVEFVERQAERASYVTSVCTGAFVLGAAQWLREKNATTHWAFVDLLPLFGARPAPGRVVRDGRLFTGGGVTAGIDFALTIATEIAGAEVASIIQLGLEYDPMPPLDRGHPSKAPAEMVDRLTPRFAKSRALVEAAATRSA